MLEISFPTAVIVAAFAGVGFLTVTKFMFVHRPQKVKIDLSMALDPKKRQAWFLTRPNRS